MNTLSKSRQAELQALSVRLQARRHAGDLALDFLRLDLLPWFEGSGGPRGAVAELLRDRAKELVAKAEGQQS